MCCKYDMGMYVQGQVNRLRSNRKFVGKILSWNIAAMSFTQFFIANDINGDPLPQKKKKRKKEKKDNVLGI